MFSVIADNVYKLVPCGRSATAWHFLFPSPAPTGLLVVAMTAASRGELLF